jgi:hypothetical protein
MSLRAELETWSAALSAYDEEDFVQALVIFSQMAPSSKILTNIGLIFATMGEHERAVENFIEATHHDEYLAVASVLPCRSFPVFLSCYRYFQCGVSNFLLGRYDVALTDFDGAWLRLRGNQEMCVHLSSVTICDFPSLYLAAGINSSVSVSSSMLPKSCSTRVSVTST